MKNHSYSLRKFFTLALLTTVLCSNAFAQENRDWLFVESENFKINSTLSENDSVELLQFLESARVAIAFLTGIRKLEAVIPTEIFVTKRSSDLHRFGIGGMNDIAGLFIPGVRKNTVLLYDNKNMSANIIVLHEYVHFLMNNNSSVLYPRWLSEGMAEYLSNAEFKRGKFRIGLANERVVLLHREWLPLSRVLSGEEINRWEIGQFYAASWALVHYLHNDPEMKVGLPNKLANYLTAISQGGDRLEAFEQAFSISIEDLNYAIKRYSKKNSYNVFAFDAEKLTPNFTPKVTELSKPEISLKLAQLDLARSRDFESAERLYRIAHEDESLRAQAESGLGDVRKFQDQFEAALPYFERALELDDQDPYLQIDMAQYWGDYAYYLAKQEAEASGEDIRFSQIALNMEYITKARQHYLKAWQLNDSIPEVYLGYGMTFMIPGENKDKALEMLEEASLILPAHIGIKIRLADAYMATNQESKAQELAKLVLAWSHSESDISRRAREILGIPSENPEEETGS